MRLLQSARSWYTISIPLSRASRGRWKWCRLALEEDLPRARGVVSGEDLDEGGLAGAVVAHEAHDLPDADVEIDVLEGLDGPEVLRNASHRENGHARPSPSLRAATRPPAGPGGPPGPPGARSGEFLHRTTPAAKRGSERAMHRPERPSRRRPTVPAPDRLPNRLRIGLGTGSVRGGRGRQAGKPAHHPLVGLAQLPVPEPAKRPGNDGVGNGARRGGGGAPIRPGDRTDSVVGFAP